MKAKVSAQAQQVLNVLASRRCHLTADEILENLEGIGTAGQDCGNLSTGEDTSVLYLCSVYQSLVYQVAGVDIREQQDICIALDLTVSSTLMLCSFRINCQIHRQRAHLRYSL